MRKPSSLALVSAGYPPHRSGGIDVQTYDLAHALSAAGVDVTVFCGGAASPTLLKENENLKILRMPMANAPPQVVWFQLQNLGTLKRDLRNYDIVHTQHSSGSFYGFSRESPGSPWIVSFHDHQLRRLKIFFDVKPWNLGLGDIFYYLAGYPVFEFLTRIELRRADHYIACGGSGFRDYVHFSKMNPAKTTIIPNGIDVEKINRILSTFGDSEGPREDDNLVLFNCGRLYASKGIHLLLKAMPYVLKEFENVRLRIFGRGPLRSYLKNLIYRLGLEKNATLEGHVSYDKLIHEMSRSDLAVFPSMIEVGASLAVMEAMACRLPVLAFEYPFSMEIIQHLKTGYHVPPKNLKALAEGICVLLGDPKLRKKLGENACENVLRNHDMKSVVNKYLDVYSKVIEMRK